MSSEKIGLVLEGGASRTYYSCGILDGFLDTDIFVDYIIGTSAGIANGVSYISKQRGRSYIVGTQYAHDKHYQGKKYLLNPHSRSYYNLDYVFDEIPNKLLPFDYKTFAEYKGEVVAALTNIETGKAEYHHVSRNDRKSMVLRASCALPLLFQPIEINSSKFMDGGICDSIPAKQAFESGCNKCIVILTQPRSYIKKFDKSLTLAAHAYHKYPQFANAILNRPDVYNENRQEVFHYENEGKAFVFAPSEPLLAKRTESNPEDIKRIYNMGYRDFRKQLPKLREFLNFES